MGVEEVAVGLVAFAIYGVYAMLSSINVGLAIFMAALVFVVAAILSVLGVLVFLAVVSD